MKQIKAELRKYIDKEKVNILQGFFKTGKGQYGEGDVFLGVSVPQVRKIAQDASGRLSFGELQQLINSKIHEERLVALLILVSRYQGGDELEKERIFKFYKTNTSRVNNWDLVDLSAPSIMGDYLLEKDRSLLYSLAVSENLWERRIAIISTFAFIRSGQFEDTLKISEILMGDEHDLIHKAVGWMLREVGKRDRKVLEEFLRENYSNLPRTTLRYAIERFGVEERKRWLLGL
ncbi:MAG: DNA alkylation repair protein [Nanoarchaeota archaeon]|nr:DNA alkylation repair protein [Nanoarchaeota archaeon]